MTDEDDDGMEEITVEDLVAAEKIAKPFYETLAGTDSRIVTIACGLLLRCMVEELVENPEDESEWLEAMEAVMDTAATTANHPAISRATKTRSNN